MLESQSAQQSLSQSVGQCFFSSSRLLIPWVRAGFQLSRYKNLLKRYLLHTSLFSLRHSWLILPSCEYFHKVTLFQRLFRNNSNRHEPSEAFSSLSLYSRTQRDTNLSKRRPNWNWADNMPPYTAARTIVRPSSQPAAARGHRPIQNRTTTSQTQDIQPVIVVYSLVNFSDERDRSHPSLQWHADKWRCLRTRPWLELWPRIKECLLDMILIPSLFFNL